MITLVENVAPSLDGNLSSISTVDIELLQFIENKLINIFFEDTKLEIPVFLSIREGIIQKLAYFLSGAVSKSVGIGIAGETASGKSTVAFDIIDTVCRYQKENNCDNLITRVNTDDYYYDRSEMVKAAGSFDEFVKNYDLDCPDAFELDLLNKHIQQLVNGEDVWLPKYDMGGTAIRLDNHHLAKTANIIISEGLYTLTDKVKDVFDFKIYVDVSAPVQKERWYRRAAERDLGESADGVFLNAVQKAQTYVKPTIENADIVLNGEAKRSSYMMFTDKILDLIFSIHSKSRV